MVRYLRYNLLISRMTMGMYKTDRNSSKYVRFFYRSLRILCNIVMCSGTVLSIVSIANKETTEINEIALEIMTAVIFFCALFRANYFYWREDELEKVVDTINKNFKHKTSTGLEEQSLGKYDRITKIFVLVWSFSLFFTGEFMALLPLTVIHKVGRILPLPLWYPYDWKQSPYYELTYFTQVLSQFFMVFSYGNSDMFYSCTTIMLAAQFRLFGWELKNLVYTVLLKQNVPKVLVLEFRDICAGKLRETDTFVNSKEIHNDIFRVMATESFKLELNKALVECVKQHQNLLDSCDCMQEFYSPLLLPEMLFGIFYCIFIMYAAVVTTDPSILTTLVEYSAMCYAQIFCMTYVGQQLFDKSEMIFNETYEIPWYLCDENFKKMFSIVQIKLMKPVTITAWKFFDMKLSTFLFAVKTSFTFLTFLRQVTQNETK